LYLLSREALLKESTRSYGGNEQEGGVVKGIGIVVLFHCLLFPSLAFCRHPDREISKYCMLAEFEAADALSRNARADAETRRDPLTRIVLLAEFERR
jgi:hypothetical protein